MADTKTSALTDASALGGTEQIPGVQSAANVKMTPAQLATYALSVDPIHPGYVAGRWYFAEPGQIVAASAIGVNSIRFMPFRIFKPVTITQLGARVTTISAAGNFQLAIYANNSTTDRPTGNPLGATGNMSTGTATVVAAVLAGGNITLQPGTYWSAICQDNGTACYTALATTYVSNTGVLIGTATQATLCSSTAAVGWYLSLAQTFGTWPDVTSGGFAEATGTANVALQFLTA
jgi:hypothetical protein